MTHIPQRSGLQRSGLQLLIDDLPGGLVMAEIGSYAGESAEMFMLSGKVDKIYCIDPWLKPDSHMREAEKYFDLLCTKYNITKLKGTIATVFEKLPMLDFVYIDGDHSYQAVMTDIKTILPKIKPRGIIAGHDYGVQYEARVVRAVNESIGVPNKIYPDTSWMTWL